MYYKRIIDSYLSEWAARKVHKPILLRGARQVGKSTLLKERFPKAVYIDLLNSELRTRFRQHPEEFRESLLRFPAETLIIVDEIFRPRYLEI